MAVFEQGAPVGTQASISFTFHDSDRMPFRRPGTEFEFENGKPRASSFPNRCTPTSLRPFPHSPRAPPGPPSFLPRPLPDSIGVVVGLELTEQNRLAEGYIVKLCPLYKLFITVEGDYVVKRDGPIGVHSEFLPDRPLAREGRFLVTPFRIDLSGFGAELKRPGMNYGAQLGISLEAADLERVRARLPEADFFVPASPLANSSSITSVKSYTRLAFQANNAGPAVTDGGEVQDPTRGCYNGTALDPQLRNITVTMAVVGGGADLTAASNLFETDDSEATVKCSFTGITKETRDFGTGGLFLGLVAEDRLAAFEAAPAGAPASLLVNFFDSGAVQAIDLRTHTQAIDDGYATFTFPCAARNGTLRYKCALVAGSSARTKLQPGYIDERGRVSEDGFDGARPLLAVCPDKVVAKSADKLHFKLAAGLDVSEPKIDAASNRLGCSVTAPLKRCGDLAVAVSTRADLEEMARTFQRAGPRVSGGRALRHVGYTPLNPNMTYANTFVGVQVLSAGALQGAVCVLASMPRRAEASHGIFKIGAEAASVAPPPPVPALPGENVNPPDTGRPTPTPKPADPNDPNQQLQQRGAALLDPASPSFAIPNGPVPLLRDPIDLLAASAENRTATEGGAGGRGAAPVAVFVVPTQAFRGDLDARLQRSWPPQLDARLQNGLPSTWAADYRRAQGKSAPEFVVALKCAPLI
eukprot:tig00020951_g16457.t1